MSCFREVSFQFNSSTNCFLQNDHIFESAPLKQLEQVRIDLFVLIILSCLGICSEAQYKASFIKSLWVQQVICASSSHS